MRDQNERTSEFQRASGEDVAGASRTRQDRGGRLHREYVLSQIRQQIGFTQADVAERLGVSQPTYAECERGSNMRISTLQKIVTALGGELSLHVLIADRDYNLQMPQPQ